jgi:RNA polymerase sigma-70 factor (ECF subfamily)
MDDSALIRQAQRGDQVALARLLQQHYLAVKKYLVTVTFDRSLAEDLTQETMIRAIQRIGQFGGRSRFTTWLMAIATNLYVDYLRRQQREQRLERRVSEALLLEQADLSPSARELLAELQQLPRAVALPVILKHYYGYTYEEIAEWVGIPVGTVKSRIFNAVRTLRRGLLHDDTPGE